MVRNKNTSSHISSIQPCSAPIPRQDRRLEERLDAVEVQKTPEKFLQSSCTTSPQSKMSARIKPGSLSPLKPKILKEHSLMNGTAKLTSSHHGRHATKGPHPATSHKGEAISASPLANGLGGTHSIISPVTRSEDSTDEHKYGKKEKGMVGKMKDNDLHISRMTAQTNLYRKMFGVFKTGEEVLARWSDGLYYLGVICNVDEYKHQCEMEFEDKSRFWVRFKDLHRINSNAMLDESEEDEADSKKMTQDDQEDELDVNCVLCRDGVSDPPNEIVLCDKCGQGYHQLCHLPHIDTAVLKDEEVPWQCRNCVFSACVRSGGAISHGIGEIMMQMKCVHPYDMKSLSWNKNHKINSEEIYCYCGGPGDWYLKMLQCARCDQWFHEACLQCLDSPILYGDRFFLFVCAVCNNNSEYIKRLPMKWVDVVHLVLYNITIARKVKYYDSDVMTTFFNKHMDSLRLGDLAKEVATRSHLRQKILDVLHSNKAKFQCGNEQKKSKVVWGLKNRSPPLPPSISLPAGIEINDEVLATIDLRHGSGSLSDSPTPLKKKGPCQSMGAHTKSLENVNGRSPVKDLVKSGLFNVSSNKDPQDNLFERFRVDVLNHQAPIVSISDCNMPPPKKRRGRPKKSYEVAPPSGPLKRTSSSWSLNSSKSSWSGPPNKKRKRKLSDVSRDSNGSGRTSEAGSSVSRLWSVNNSLLDEGSSCSSGSAGRRGGDPDSLKDAIARYFGAEGRVECGERFRIRGKRIRKNPDGTERFEYLIEWEGYTARQLLDSQKV